MIWWWSQDKVEYSIHWQNLKKRNSSTIFHQGSFGIWLSCKNYIYTTTKSEFKKCQKCIGMLIKYEIDYLSKLLVKGLTLNWEFHWFGMDQKWSGTSTYFHSRAMNHTILTLGGNKELNMYTHLFICTQTAFEISLAHLLQWNRIFLFFFSFGDKDLQNKHFIPVR